MYQTYFFQGAKYAMYIVLPRARTGLRQLLNDINPFVLRRRIQQLEDVPVDVSIPKFKFDFTSHLENVLREVSPTLRFTKHDNNY